MRNLTIKRLITLVISVFLLHSSTVFANVNNHKTLIFFFSSECVYCREMADVLLNVTKKHQVRIIANSYDSKKLPQFPNSISDLDLIRKFKISAFPTLVAVDMHKKEFELMCNGLEDESLVEAKVLAWINNA
jgi:thiol-disulfide isomerase/thioredoxin